MKALNQIYRILLMIGIFIGGFAALSSYYNECNCHSNCSSSQEHSQNFVDSEMACHHCSDSCSSEHAQSLESKCNSSHFPQIELIDIQQSKSSNDWLQLSLVAFVLLGILEPFATKLKGGFASYAPPILLSEAFSCAPLRAPPALI